MSMTRFLFLILFVALLGSCAIVSRPSGGDKDVTPPKLDSLESTKNFQTNSYPEEIVLEFDEFIQLKNASQNIVLTPTPSSGKPKYEQRGRTVKVDLSEVEFRDSTTYQFQFGDAIQDYNEGNPAKELRFVFSTGSFVDSLFIRGTVEDNVTGEAGIDVLVGLYRSPSDTILTKSAPDYFTRTDSSGRFKIDYLSAGTYQLAAYLDDNANYRYNQGLESVGFLDELVEISGATQDTSYSVFLSAELPPIKALRGDQWFPGLVRITLNQAATPEIEVSNIEGTILARSNDADSIFIAYDPPIDTLEYVLLSLQGETDTVRLRKTDRTTTPKLSISKKAKTIAGESLVELSLNLPLSTIDAGLILVEVDSVAFATGEWTIETGDLRNIRWQVPTDTVSAFEIKFLPGAMTTVFDSTNLDTLFARVRPAKKSDFGEVELTIGGLDSLTSYVVELLDSRGEVERTIQLAVDEEGRPSNDASLKLARVKGGDYTVRIIEDLNKDGRYTPGNRRLDLQPERSSTLPLNTVRADWLVEERLELNF